MPRRGVILAACLVATSLLVGSAGAESVRQNAIVWNGAFVPGKLVWAGLQARPGGFAVVPAPGRPGWAGRFVVTPGASPISSGERAEVFRQSVEAAGNESFWSWSVYFPREFASNPNAAWNVFTQWHQTGPTGVQPFSFEVENKQGRETIRLRVWGGNPADPHRRAWSLGLLERQRWYDFALRVKWADDRSGLVQLWLNGRRVVSASGFPTLYAGQGVYLKQGFYRGPSNLTTTLYIAGTRQLASLDDLRALGASRPPRHFHDP